ncbi:MAG: transcriptional regulator, ArsR family [Ignavibacteria bacterium]|nr:transcriptional regulator, ArsR family [Ignavibacteria bacterium]
MKSQTKVFSDADLHFIALRFKILSEPSRLKILKSLSHGELCVTELISKTGLLQANLSKQLKILCENDFITCRQQGLQRFYKIKDQEIFTICNAICKN